jgi:hypothetical protein
MEAIKIVVCNSVNSSLSQFLCVTSQEKHCYGKVYQKHTQEFYPELDHHLNINRK